MSYDFDDAVSILHGDMQTDDYPPYLDELDPIGAPSGHRYDLIVSWDGLTDLEARMFGDLLRAEIRRCAAEQGVDVLNTFIDHAE